MTPTTLHAEKTRWRGDGAAERQQTQTDRQLGGVSAEALVLPCQCQEDKLVKPASVPCQVCPDIAAIMFRRKLTALDYMNPDNFHVNDEKSFRDLVVWLEDQKIRHYKIEDRGALKAVEEKDWATGYRRYLGSLNCPINPNERAAVLDWLLGLAVRFEYGDNVDTYKSETAENVRNRQKSGPKMVNTNPLDALDFQSPEFRDGVNRLASQLGVTQHPDHLVTLKAISKLITSRLSAEAMQNPGEVIHQGKAYPIFEADLGFETGDPVLNNAGKALRLMYIHDLRNLQTHINESIVAVQTITANPKTDTKLGKVGR
ncbi:RNA transcription, translation and transport factor protein-like [Portunus trituberculatus]|uniref:RNA transcription, translation and transport factor protein-like n=1 Tax=Portunus trituberculatus TaxID=210409 RepID=UPI001E1D1D47|nr:RNA transcription, translation and transport factor protein-like [Portunus trituberculatus]